MSNTIDWGKAAINNTLGFGQAAKNSTLGFGEVEAASWSGETNITGTPSAPSFSNVNSFSFDGVDDTFLIPTLPSTFTDLSISFWLKKGVDSTNAYVFARSTSQWLIFQNGTNNSLKYRLITNGGTYTKIGGAILDNQWHHCAFVWDSSANTFDIFEDGVKIGTSTTTSGSLISSTASAYIFSYVNGAPYSSGNVDELAIFDSALSQSDVSAIYNNGEPQSLDAYSPLVWFRMGDNATWNGATWTMTSVGTDTRIARSINMVEANRTTDVPTAPTFSNTKSIALDGVDDYVNVADNSNLSFGNGSTDSPFSISTWIKIGQTTAQGIVTKYGSISSTREYLFYTTGGKLRLLFIDASNGANNFATGTTNLSTNTWYHVACTYDGRGGSTAYNGITLYINGVAESVTTSGGSYTAMSNTSQNVEIGKYSTNELLGNLDETAIFNTELSQSDVTAIYGGGSPSSLSSYSSLISWWRCGDGDTSPTLTDNGSGGNDGTMTNFTTFSTDVPT